MIPRTSIVLSIPQCTRDHCLSYTYRSYCQMSITVLELYIRKSWNYVQPIVLETDIYNNINIILFQQKKFHIHNGRRMTVIDKIIQIKYLPSQPLRMAGFCWLGSNSDPVRLKRNPWRMMFYFRIYKVTGLTL